MMMSSINNVKGRYVGVLGGGIAGLTAAFYLLRAGARVKVIEANAQLGGLSTYFNFGSFHWDKFYHCILTTDKPLLQLIDDLGLSEQLRWTATRVGFFTNNALHSMSSTWDFVRFPALSLWEKFRLGLGILYASRIKEGRQLEEIPVSQWLIRIFGKGNYEKMWGPLLKCKLGACREEASAAFIWATIFRLYSTREKNASQKEKMGYVRGGYRTVFQRIIREIERMGGSIETGVAVQEVRSVGGGRLTVRTAHGQEQFDAVVSTVPSKVLAKIAPDLSKAYREKLDRVKYLGVVCVVLVMKRRLTPFYCTNLTEADLPFTGLIEMTNLISHEETQGRHLFYVPKYTAPGDPLFEASDAEVWDLFAPQLRRIFPDLQEQEIEKRFVFRERLVQPVPVLRYSSIVPEMKTNVPGLLVANTTQIVNSTLNNNEMVKISKRAVETLQRGLSCPNAKGMEGYGDTEKQVVSVSDFAVDRS
jgi:protoporphyrinogen oxidase